MGIYDRDYYREDSGRSMLGDWSAVTILIVINVAVFFVDMFSDNHWPVRTLSLRPDLLTHPWEAWQLLTYGFLHDPSNLEHIGFNMFFLWMFGKDVEQIYGRKEFLRIYIAFVIMTGLAWVILQRVFQPDNRVPCIGASGAIMSIMAIYICHFPQRQFLLFFVLPMPAWVMGIVCIGMDFGEALSGTDHVAHTAHLAGVAFVLCTTRPAGVLLRSCRGSCRLRGRPRCGGDGRNCTSIATSRTTMKILTVRRST